MFKFKVAFLKKAKNGEVSRLSIANYTTGVENTLKID